MLIIRKPSVKYSAVCDIPEDEQYVPLRGRTRNKITAIKSINIQSETQACVPVQCKKVGRIIVKPHERM